MMIGHDKICSEQPVQLAIPANIFCHTHQNPKASFVFLNITEVCVVCVTANTTIFFFGLFGDGERIEITIKMIYTLQ
jgi:hypothetical protein